MFLSKEEVYLWTENKPNSWFMVDLGESRRAVLNKYVLRYASAGNLCCPRNWLFQASNKITQLLDNPFSSDWTTLYCHKNDKSIYTGFGLASWKIYSKQEFRYFRVIQTGPNATLNDKDWEHIFVVSGFEIYGQLITLSPEEVKANYAVDIQQIGEKKVFFVLCER